MTTIAVHGMEAIRDEDRMRPPMSEGRKRLDLRLLALSAGCVYILQGLSWPVSEGRDFFAYTAYYFDMWNPYPVYHFLMLYAKPLSPLLFGTVLQIGGSTLAEIVAGILYVLSVLTVYHIGLRWSRWVGIASAVAVMLHTSYGLLYHQLGTEVLFALVFVLWTAYVLRTGASPSAMRFVWHGLFVFVLVMIRASNQMLLVFAFFPFTLPSLSLRRKISYASLFLVAVGVLLLSFSTYNYVRYGDFTVSRGTWAVMPLWRLWRQGLVKPENGPASAALAEAVRTDLLTKEPYLSHGVDLDTFFSSRNRRMWADLVGLSDRIWGWDSDYSVLRAVSLEAVAAHPLAYARSAVRSLISIFDKKVAAIPIESGAFADRQVQEGAPAAFTQDIPIHEEPVEMPRSYLWFLASSRDNRLKADPQSVELVIEDTQMRLRAATLSDRVNSLEAQLPPRDRVAAVAHVLNSFAQVYPSMSLWIVLGLLGLAFRPERATLVLVTVVGLALAVIALAVFGVEAMVYYRIPLDPLFIVFGIVGLSSCASRVRYALGTRFVRTLPS